MYLVSDSISFLILFFTVLIYGSVLYYRKYIAIYSAFPRKSLLFYILKCILLSKIPKHIPYNFFIFQFIIDTCKQFQTKGLCLLWFFQPYLFIYSKESFKIFSYDKSCVDKPHVFDLFKEIVKESLLTSCGNMWGKRRKMLNPVFYTPNLKAKTEMINRNAHLLVGNLLKYNNEAASDILNFLKDCAFRNFCEFFTGLKSNPDEVKISIDAAETVTAMITYRVLKPWFLPRCFLFLSPKRRWILETIEKAFKFSETTLKKMKDSLLLNEVENEFCRNSQRSFGKVIFEQHAKDPTYTIADMQGELNALIGAGFETVSYATMWCLFLLGHHSDVQEQVYEEVESVLGNNNEVSYVNLENLKYLECVIKETLRIYPIVPFYTRRTVKDTPCGKYTVPKGTNIVLFTYLLHRDPDMFPDPEKFDPERFLEENSDEKLMTQAFAEGARNCIGKNFAMMELKIILAHLIRNFKVTSLDHREDVLLGWAITLVTAKPLRICLTPREPIPFQ